MGTVAAHVIELIFVAHETPHGVATRHQDWSEQTGDGAMTAAIPDDAKVTYARRRVPLRRYGLPEEVAHMTLNLCLPASSFVNGATIAVDGGMTIRHT